MHLELTITKIEKDIIDQRSQIVSKYFELKITGDTVDYLVWHY